MLFVVLTALIYSPSLNSLPFLYSCPVEGLFQYFRLYSVELYYGYLRINVKDVEGSEHVLILGIVPALVWNDSGRDAYILVTIVMIRGIFRKWRGIVGTGWSGLRIWTGGGHL
jgi:hypothetical protein